MIGKTISHYIILEELGRGGMGVVYKAMDTKLEREVAIKFLSSDVAGESEERERFKIEARSAAALNHPGIATIHAIEEAEDMTFIVMEFIDGHELKKKVESGPLKLAEVLDIGAQIADGLQAAHDKEIIHRDIKNTNIMVTEKGRAKIMDFGLAKLRGVSHHAKAGTTFGTIAYMSPEQIQSIPVDHRTDLWSFGVLLYEMLAGQLPFRGDYEAAIIYEILNREPKAIQSFRSDVPDHIIELVAQLLQKDPISRLSSAKEAAIRLRASSAVKDRSKEKKSIAVLYFENMSAEKENEYFCAGMTEDLIIDLSKIQGLRVIPRSDVQPFRGKGLNIRQIGEALGVNFILEGSVRKATDKLRITAQLIDVKSGFQVWAERYDRLIEDIFNVQMEVSETIAEALKVSLTESEKQSLAKKPTDDLRAYDFYLRGSEFLSRRAQKDRETAIRMFEHALAIDPNFALVYVALAEAYSFEYLYIGDRVWLEKTIAVSEKALSIDPDLVEAQFGIGMAYFHQRRFAEAKKVLEEVIKKKHDFYQALHWLGWTSDVLGDYDAAISFYKSSASLKPYSEEPWHLIEQSYRRKGDLESAEESGDKVIELAERKLEVNPKDVLALSRVAITYVNKGMKEKSLDAMKRALEFGPDDFMVLYNCTCAYAAMGDREAAFDCLLNQALQKGIRQSIDWMKDDPYLESIRDDQRFKDIISKYGG